MFFLSFSFLARENTHALCLTLTLEKKNAYKKGAHQLEAAFLGRPLLPGERRVFFFFVSRAREFLFPRRDGSVGGGGSGLEFELQSAGQQGVRAPAPSQPALEDAL